MKGPATLGPVLALALSVAGCASPGQIAGIVPTADMPIGSCHRMSDPYELYSTSDVAPPVPCDTPHQTETLAVVPLPRPLAGLSQRPVRTPGITWPVCTDVAHAKLRGYLGADDYDQHWGIYVWPKLPTEAEWAAGLRVVRCDLIVASPGHAEVPAFGRPLRGIMRLAASVAVRHCRLDATDVGCDRPHTQEQIGGWAEVTGKRYPGLRSVQAQLDDQCWRSAEQYTAGAIDNLPVRIWAAPITKANWQRGVRTRTCWIIARHGKTLTGTLRADLSKGA